MNDEQTELRLHQEIKTTEKKIPLQTEQSEKRDFFFLVLLDPVFVCQDEANKPLLKHFKHVPLIASFLLFIMVKTNNCNI